MKVSLGELYRNHDFRIHLDSNSDITIASALKIAKSRGPSIEVTCRALMISGKVIWAPAHAGGNSTITPLQCHAGIVSYLGVFALNKAALSLN